jgi:Ser/Thr protein kinase RdoA (MazF antagonist)
MIFVFLIDLDMSGYGCMLFDIAQFINKLLRQNKVEYIKPLLKDFVVYYDNDIDLILKSVNLISYYRFANKQILFPELSNELALSKKYFQ